MPATAVKNTPEVRTLRVRFELGQVADLLNQLSDEDLDTLDLLMDKQQVRTLRNRAGDYDQLERTGQLVGLADMWRRIGP